MRGVKNATLQEVCAGFEDPRADRVNKFSLVELLFAAMITVLCGAVSYADMAQMGEKKLEWFRRYLAYDNGMPKAGTFRDVLCRLDPDEVHKAFIAWMKGAVETLQAAGVIAVDGKTAKGSKTDTQKPCLDEGREGFEVDCARTEDRGHGRTEVRECIVRYGRDWMVGTAVNGPASTSRLSSGIRPSEMDRKQSRNITLSAAAKTCLLAPYWNRSGHWSVENKLRWVLDVQFGEDSFRIRADHSAENVSALRQIAWNTLRETPGMKGSFRSRQLECLPDEQALSRAAETMGFEPMPAA